jgi:hypothetical protein
MKRYSLGVIPFRPARPRPLAIPLAGQPEVNIAQVSVFPEFKSARPFRREKWSDLEAFQPNIVIGYGFDLERLAESIIEKEFGLSSVDRAIFALTDCGSNPIGPKLRDKLWETFGVPVYELIIAPGCRLLAAECETHDGWHMQPGADAYLIWGEVVCDLPPLTNLHTGFTGEIDAAACACGRATTRLKNLGPCLPRPYERELAAIA